MRTLQTILCLEEKYSKKEEKETAQGTGHTANTITENLSSPEALSLVPCASNLSGSKTLPQRLPLRKLLGRERQSRLSQRPP